MDSIYDPVLDSAEVDRIIIQNNAEVRILGNTDVSAHIASRGRVEQMNSIKSDFSVMNVPGKDDGSSGSEQRAVRAEPFTPSVKLVAKPSTDFVQATEWRNHLDLGRRRKNVRVPLTKTRPDFRDALSEEIEKKLSEFSDLAWNYILHKIKSKMRMENLTAFYPPWNEFKRILRQSIINVENEMNASNEIPVSVFEKPKNTDETVNITDTDIYRNNIPSEYENYLHLLEKKTEALRISLQREILYESEQVVQTEVDKTSNILKNVLERSSIYDLSETDPGVIRASLDDLDLLSLTNEDILSSLVDLVVPATLLNDRIREPQTAVIDRSLLRKKISEKMRDLYDKVKKKGSKTTKSDARKDKKNYIETLNEIRSLTIKKARRDRKTRFESSYFNPLERKKIGYKRSFIKLSKEEYYSNIVSIKKSEEKDKVEISVPIEHSPLAERFEGVCANWTSKALRNYHRPGPTRRIPWGKMMRLYKPKFRKEYTKADSPDSLSVLVENAEKSDFSERNEFMLLEYLEEKPMLVQNYGMNSKLVYLKQKRIKKFVVTAPKEVDNRKRDELQRRVIRSSLLKVPMDAGRKRERIAEFFRKRNEITGADVVEDTGHYRSIRLNQIGGYVRTEEVTEDHLIFNAPLNRDTNAIINRNYAAPVREHYNKRAIDNSAKNYPTYENDFLLVFRNGRMYIMEIDSLWAVGKQTLKNEIEKGKSKEMREYTKDRIHVIMGNYQRTNGTVKIPPKVYRAMFGNVASENLDFFSPDQTGYYKFSENVADGDPDKEVAFEACVRGMQEMIDLNINSSFKPERKKLKFSAPDPDREKYLDRYLYLLDYSPWEVKSRHGFLKDRKKAIYRRMKDVFGVEIVFHLPKAMIKPKRWEEKKKKKEDIRSLKIKELRKLIMSTGKYTEQELIDLPNYTLRKLARHEANSRYRDGDRSSEIVKLADRMRNPKSDEIELFLKAQDDSFTMMLNLLDHGLTNAEFEKFYLNKDRFDTEDDGPNLLGQTSIKGRLREEFVPMWEEKIESMEETKADIHELEVLEDDPPDNLLDVAVPKVRNRRLKAIFSRYRFTDEKIEKVKWNGSEEGDGQDDDDEKVFDDQAFVDNLIVERLYTAEYSTFQRRKPNITNKEELLNQVKSELEDQKEKIQKKLGDGVHRGRSSLGLDSGTIFNVVGNNSNLDINLKAYRSSNQ